jgi:signal transduction histidine kinase
VATVDGMVVLRRNHGVEARSPHALLLGIAVTGIGGLALTDASQPSRAGEFSIPLEPPLASLVLRGRVPPSPMRPPVAGFVVILVIYGLSAVVAMVGLYRALRAAQAQADFLAEVSHELKTPIASVRAMAEFLADGPADDEAKVRDYARRIEGEMGRLGTSVRNVLDAARIERKGRLPVTPRLGDPAVVVERVAAAVGPGLEARGFTVDVRADPARTPVLLDESALQSAVTNLVDNAAKFSKDVREIEIEAMPVGEKYRIGVRDRGRGIDRKDAERLFRRFERGEGVRQDAVPGVGLGLYVVHEIVEAHGGTVWGRPRRGGGAVFTIDLPMDGGGASIT